MTKDKLKEYVECGNEIEFKFNGKMYSITYGIIDEKEVISFCEFHKETTEVETFDELINVFCDGVTVLQMWESVAQYD